MHRIVYIYLLASFFTLSLHAADVPFNESRIESLSKGMCDEFGKLGSCDHEHPFHCISNASVVPRQGTRGLFTLKNPDQKSLLEWMEKYNSMLNLKNLSSLKDEKLKALTFDDSKIPNGSFVVIKPGKGCPTGSGEMGIICDKKLVQIAKTPATGEKANLNSQMLTTELRKFFSKVYVSKSFLDYSQIYGYGAGTAQPKDAPKEVKGTP